MKGRLTEKGKQKTERERERKDLQSPDSFLKCLERSELCQSLQVNRGVPGTWAFPCSVSRLLTGSWIISGGP